MNNFDTLSTETISPQRVLAALKEARAKLAAVEQSKQERVAIVGMAGRFPGAETIEQFWQNLCQGIASIQVLNPSTLNETTSELSTESSYSANYVNAYASFADIAGFDAAFFGYSPREAELLDPQHRVFLECAWTALEHAGYDPDRYPGRIGVYAGAGLNSYLINLYTHPNLRNSVDRVQAVVSNVMGLMPTRVSYKLNLTGPSCGIQTGCSTSLVAVHLACQSLLNRECDMALAGGVSIDASEQRGYRYQNDGVLSPDGVCRAFDAAAQGTVFGNGVGIVVLKRLSEAVRDGDSIYAVIKGSAINNDGAQKVGLTAPSVTGQAAVITTALERANCSPETIQYIEAHGTGTALGDPIEIAALTKAFRQHTQKQQFCAIGSLKTNIGHLDAAAGIAGLIKTALALKHRQIPPSLNFQSTNPQIDFEHSPFYVNTQLRNWGNNLSINDSPRRAGVSSFGMGGTNAHLILEEAPEISKATSQSHSHHLLLLSAKTPSALHTSIQQLADHLTQHPDLNLTDVAVTPLSAYGKPYTPPKHTVNPNQDMSAPPEQVDKMDAATFFGMFADLMKDNPPHANDYPMLDRMKRIGIEPGKSFTLADAPPEVQDALNAAPAAALKLIKQVWTYSGTYANGWRTNLTAIGTYGTDYLHRAGVAYAGLGANVIEDAIYPTVFTDEDGQPLHSDKQYVLHFEPDQIPPVRAFWSLTMYDERQLFTANSIDRYAIGDRDNLTFNPDGSLDLYIQRESPGKDQESNWLPAPQSGAFTMNLRLYWPKAEALNGTWAPPSVKRVK
ncbi:beta-ketoacyl synthase N-terminal-like domain-containing protein [Leptolyngbya sp. 7M]|uniref:beta-ketoacyl synthase N-terminal-like domain-containing protein n=1 Tax=Leptolyngbya sp. 7M TaxID=2812896 RepID=UPI0021F103BC|nr:beta-ketoacyl synthase N-terminal-like domain-containing protein [Leptolyngbya sp. 7M]